VSYQIKPLSCDPARIKGMSERLIVSHYENNHGAPRTDLNAALDKTASTRS
jgi:Fe-Mn family superoxide dismutase